MEEDLNRTRRTSTTVLTTDRQAGRQTQAAKKKKKPGRVSVAGTGQQKTHILEALELLSKTLLPLPEESVRGTWDSKAEASVPSTAARSIRCSFRAGPHSGRGFISFLVHWEHTHTDTAKAGVSSVQS